MSNAKCKILKLALLSAVVALTGGCQTEQAVEEVTDSEQAQETVKYGVRVQSGPMDDLLVKDYKPGSSLRVPETKVDKPRVPVIDVHSHTGMSRIKTGEDVDDWVRTMDQAGVEKTIVFTGAIGDEFERQVKLFGKYPDRFQLWCDLYTEDAQAEDYPERAVQELVRCYELGARGVGEITDKGWGLQGSGKDLPQEKRLRFNDPRVDAFWKKCAELKMPVNFHVADHPSCWQPLGPNQERTPDFQHFNMTDKDVPAYEELLKMRDEMLVKHPETIFVACHMSNQGNDTVALAKALEKYPNLYLDIAARDYELGRQPRTASAFLARYKDRIMFGTDMGRDLQMYRGWWRLLESSDEYIPGRVWWPYYGLELSEEVLESLYRGTALKVLTWD
jgi:predicted TIM-barrel fold metal-dependent hydrolase